MARVGRECLGRVVRFLAAAGIRQYLDIGSGIPTKGNVHEVAQGAAPGSRVVYVDLDPVAVAHSKAIPAGNENATVIDADLREPEQILAHESTRDLIDFGQPVGLLLCAVLHFTGDDENPQRILATLRDARHRACTFAHGRRSCACSTASSLSTPDWSTYRSGGRIPPRM